MSQPFMLARINYIDTAVPIKTVIGHPDVFWEEILPQHLSNTKTVDFCGSEEYSAAAYLIISINNDDWTAFDYFDLSLLTSKQIETLTTVLLQHQLTSSRFKMGLKLLPYLDEVYSEKMIKCAVRMDDFDSIEIIKQANISQYITTRVIKYCIKYGHLDRAKQMIHIVIEEWKQMALQQKWTFGDIYYQDYANSPRLGKDEEMMKILPIQLMDMNSADLNIIEFTNRMLSVNPTNNFLKVPNLDTLEQYFEQFDFTQVTPEERDIMIQFVKIFHVVTKTIRAQIVNCQNQLIFDQVSYLSKCAIKYGNPEYLNFLIHQFDDTYSRELSRFCDRAMYDIMVDGRTGDWDFLLEHCSLKGSRIIRTMQAIRANDFDMFVSYYDGIDYILNYINTYFMKIALQNDDVRFIDHIGKKYHVKRILNEQSSFKMSPLMLDHFEIKFDQYSLYIHKNVCELSEETLMTYLNYFRRREELSQCDILDILEEYMINRRSDRQNIDFVKSLLAISELHLQNPDISTYVMRWLNRLSFAYNTSRRNNIAIKCVLNHFKDTPISSKLFITIVTYDNDQQFAFYLLSKINDARQLQYICDKLKVKGFHFMENIIRRKAERLSK